MGLSEPFSNFTRSENLLKVRDLALKDADFVLAYILIAAPKCQFARLETVEQIAKRCQFVGAIGTVHAPSMRPN